MCHLYINAHMYTHLSLHICLPCTHVYRNSKKHEEFFKGGLCSQGMIGLGMTTLCVTLNCGLVFWLLHNRATACVEGTPRPHLREVN